MSAENPQRGTSHEELVEAVEKAKQVINDSGIDTDPSVLSDRDLHYQKKEIGNTDWGVRDTETQESIQSTGKGMAIFEQNNSGKKGFVANASIKDGKGTNLMSATTEYQSAGDYGEDNDSMHTGTLIRRYDGDGNEVYRHESSDPAMARKVAEMAANSARREAEEYAERERLRRGGARERPSSRAEWEEEPQKVERVIDDKAELARVGKRVETSPSEERETSGGSTNQERDAAENEVNDPDLPRASDYDWGDDGWDE